MGPLEFGILLLTLVGFTAIGADHSSHSDTCSHHLEYVHEFNKLCKDIHYDRWDTLIEKLMELAMTSSHLNSNTYAENLNWIFSTILNNPNYERKGCDMMHLSILGKRQNSKRDANHHHIHTSHTDHNNNKDDHHHINHNQHHTSAAPTTTAHHSHFGHLWHYDKLWWSHLDCSRQLMSFFRETIPVSVITKYQQKLLGGLLSGSHGNNASEPTTKPTTQSTIKTTITSTAKPTTENTTPTTQTTTVPTTRTTSKPTTPSTKPTTETPTKPTTQSTLNPTTPVPTTQPTTQSTARETTEITTDTTKPSTTVYTGPITPPNPVMNNPDATTIPPITTCSTCSGDDCFGGEGSMMCLPGQYCLTNVVDTSAGERNIEKRCASQDECYRKWWLGTSDRSVCFTLDGGLSFLDVDCSFCCNTHSCNAGPNLIPTQLAHFNSHT